MFKAGRQPAEIIEELYIRALSRKPTADETAELTALVGSNIQERKIYDDIFWGLLNSTEFAFNH